MTRGSVREYTAVVRGRYLAAGKKEIRKDTGRIYSSNRLPSQGGDKETA